MDTSIKLPCLKVSCLALLLFFVNHVLSDCNINLNYLCNDRTTCIPKAYICNGFPDCPGKDDEINCDIRKCENVDKYFLCRNGKSCIQRKLLCDGEADCPDASDEGDALCDDFVKYSLPTKSSNTCDINKQFKCANNVCIPVEDICNGVPNCIDKSDEAPDLCKDFDKYKCPGFLCRNKKCLQLSTYVCDGVDDCGDGSDEEHCSVDCKLEKGKFLCKSGDECIDLKKVCDGNFDCDDKSDESEECKKDQDDECKKLNCDLENSKCEKLPGGPSCVCKEGFAKNEKSKLCEDIDECDTFGMCSQGCVNLKGSYYCTCGKGFVLSDNKKSCQTTSVNASIIYTTKYNIKRIIFGQDGSFFHTAVTKSRESVGVAYDGESYYWTEVRLGREIIVKHNPDKNIKEVILTNGLEMPEYLAVDWLTKNIYFTDSARQHVAVCTNDGLSCTELVKIDQMHFPRAIALVPDQGLLIWTDWGNNSHIGVCYMDGSNAKILVDDVQWPNGLAVDMPNGRIYWIDALSSAIESIKINGEDRRMILKGVFKHPFAIDVFGDKLYWSDHETKAIEVCDKFTGKNHEVLIQGEEIFDVHVYDKSAMQYSKHGCENDPCSNLCLLKPEGKYSCACPLGMALNDDQHNCRYVTNENFLIHVGVGSYLYTNTFQAFGRSTEMIRQVDSKIHSMEFNILNGGIFYANNDEHKLFMLDKLGNTRMLMMDPNLHVTSMSFDYYGNNLYWADEIKETIEVFSLTTKKHAIIRHFNVDYRLSSIVVAPTVGEIFVAMSSPKSSLINRISMKSSQYDGTIYRFMNNLDGGDVYLTVDETEKKLYWSNAKKKRIEFSYFDGSKRKTFTKNERTPGPMTLVGDYIYWTSIGSKSMQWRRKNATGPLKLIKLDALEYFDKYEFPKVLPITTGQSVRTNNHVCADKNGGCSDICIPDGPTSKVCECEIGRIFIDSAKTKCEKRTKCDARCASDQKCIESSMMCDGRKDCIDGSDEDVNKCKQFKKCKSSQFKCDNGDCISKKLRCDKNINCKDGSDEWNCPSDGVIELCNSRQYQCPNTTQCVYRTQLCDKKDDCPDKSDESEEICSQSCLDDEFTCASGQCIPKEFKCDNRIDCYDGSDEDKDCSTICNSPYKPCRDGHCIHERFFCDGVDDCGDNFDEYNCPDNTTFTTQCDKNQFQCPSKPELCLDQFLVCNHRADCPKSEDEKDCHRCKSSEFTCLNGRCIAANLKCDGKSDCADYSDEDDCDSKSSAGPPLICSDSTYQCSDGKCIDYKSVCDLINDCANDEGGKCSEKCIRDKCDHNCKETPKGIVCFCNEGYQLKPGSDSSCIDINECESSAVSRCAQLCYNSKGSYDCACYDGFILAADGHSCKAVGDPYKMIYVIHNEIRQIESNRRDYVGESADPILGVTVDVRRNLLLYSVVGEAGIYRLNLTTKAPAEYLDDFPIAYFLTYDWLAENVYMMTSNDHRLEIQVCNMNSKKCLTIYRFKKSRLHIIAMDIDPIHKYLFLVKRTVQFTSTTKSEIIRLKLDGSSEFKMFEDAQLSDIRTLSIDVQSKSVYFTEHKTQSLVRIGYDGKNTVNLVHQSRMFMEPKVLRTFENHAYIVDGTKGKLVICKLYEPIECDDSTSIGDARQFLIAHISNQIDGENKCKMNECEEICINGDIDKKCMCRSDKGDAVVCAESGGKGNMSSQVQNSSSVAWTVFLILLLLAVILGVLYMYYKRKGLNYNLNISFNKNRGTTINEFSPARLQMPDMGEISFAEKLKPKVTFASNENANYSEIISNDYLAPPPMYTNDDLKKFGNLTETMRDLDVNTDDDDDDQQRLIK